MLGCPAQRNKARGPARTEPIGLLIDQQGGLDIAFFKALCGLAHEPCTRWA